MSCNFEIVLLERMWSLPANQQQLEKESALLSAACSGSVWSSYH
jgi:hypothetical protein